jgi:tetratricopeptide (TPR) repeat protein
LPGRGGAAAQVHRSAERGRAPDDQLATLESPHFSVRFDPERDWVLAEPALAALEAGYEAVGTWLGERAPAKVRVEIAPDIPAFQRLSGRSSPQVESAGAVGGGARDSIVVFSPRLLARGYPWRDALNQEYLNGLLTRLSAGRVPAWLRLGASRSGGSRWRAPVPAGLDAVDRSLVARALRENTLIPLAELDASLVRPPTPDAGRLAAAECELAVEHLIEGWQVEGLRRVLAALAAGAPDRGLDSAFLEAIGVTLGQFEEGWRRMLAGRGYREIEAVVVPRHHLAGGGDPDAREFAEWQPLAAQNHLRLGDLLRGRGNTRAALMEYEKARRVAPGSPYAHVRAARALLELGRAPAAAEAAREAIRLGGGGYPPANVALGAALAALGEFEGAVAALREALEINPFDPYAWRDLGRSLRRLGRAQEAQKASVTALRLGPGDAAFRRSVVETE